MTSKKRTMMGNVVSLSILQAANYIFPLLTFPFLVRVLGPSKFGLVVFAQAFSQFFIFFTDYGFNLSATREISVHRDNKKRISEIVSSVFFIRTAFAAVSFLAIAVIVLSFDRFRGEALVYFFTFGTVLGSAFFPIWLFQGMEDMKYITLLNVLAKAIFTALIFIYVRSESDYVLVPCMNALGYLVAAFIGLSIAMKKYSIHLSVPAPEVIMGQLRGGWHIFTSRMATQLYTASNVFVLGLFTSNEVVGFFAAGEKVVRALIAMFTPAFQAIYPYISRLAALSKKRARAFAVKLLILVAAASILLFLGTYFYTPALVRLVLGANFSQSITVIRVLSPLLFIIPIAYVMANLIMLPFGMDKYFSRIYISGAALNLGLLYLFLYHFGAGSVGAAWVNLITELYLTLTMALLLGAKVFTAKYTDEGAG